MTVTRKDSGTPFKDELSDNDLGVFATHIGYQGNIVKGTLAHEFQHMIYFDEHYNQGVIFTYTWLNEALSQAAEYYNSYFKNHLDWIKYDFLLNDNWYALSLTHWTRDNYGYGSIFIRYLIYRFGNTAIKNMCSTNLVGITTVEAATGTDFNTLFNDFTIALVMSGTGDSIDQKYNFTTLNLQSLTGQRGLTTTYKYTSGN